MDPKNIPISFHDCSSVFLALRCKLYTVVHNLLQKGEHFGAINFTGKFAGFTVLHHACFHCDLESVTQLLDRYRVNPSVPACDGIQPVQLAAFLGRFDVVLKILQFGVNVDTQLTSFHFHKYAISTHKWDTNFGDRMTLFTYSIINDHVTTKAYSYSQLLLIHFRPTLTIRDRNNKTLLMCAIENDQYRLVTCMLSVLSLEEINRRDNQNFTAVHWTILKETFTKFDCKNDKANADLRVSYYLNELFCSGADINVMINNDEKTRPIYLAAIHGFYSTMKFLLRKQTFFMPLHRPLFYITESFNEYTMKECHLKSIGPYQKLVVSSDYSLWIDDSYMNTVEVIIEDIYLKYLCGYPVHKEEEKLLIQLMNQHLLIKIFIRTLKIRNREWRSELEKVEVQFGKDKIFMFDALMMNQKKYVDVAKSRKSGGFKVNVGISADIMIFQEFIQERLNATRRRICLFEKWETIADRMIKSLLLPYDCVLKITKYLTNDDLESLIKAYYNNNDNFF